MDSFTQMLDAVSMGMDPRTTQALHSTFAAGPSVSVNPFDMPAAAQPAFSGEDPNTGIQYIQPPAPAQYQNGAADQPGAASPFPQYDSSADGFGTPIPGAPQILKGLMSDPEAMRRAEDLQHSVRYAFWEAAGRGKAGEFMNTDTGKMLDLSLSQLGEAVKANATKLGIVDPEVQDALTMSNLVKMGRVLTADENLRLGRITPAEHSQIMTDDLASLDALKPNQRLALQENFKAIYPSVGQLLQNAAFSQDVVNRARDNEEKNRQAQARLSLETKETMARIGISEANLKIAQDANSRENSKFQFIELPSANLKNELDITRARTERLNALSNAQSVYNVGIDKVQEGLLARERALNAMLQTRQTKWQKLSQETSVTGAEGDPEYPKKKAEMEQLYKEMQYITGQMTDVQTKMGAPSNDPRSSPFWNMMGAEAAQLTQNRDGVPNSHDIKAADPTGTLRYDLRPVVPPVWNGKKASYIPLSPEQMMDPAAREQLYDYLAEPGRLTDPSVAAVFSDPQKYAAMAQSAGWPGDHAADFQHAQRIYQHSLAIYTSKSEVQPGAEAPPVKTNKGNVDANFKPAVPETPAAPVKPALKKTGNPLLDQAAEKGLTLPGGEPATPRSPDAGYTVQRSTYLPGENWRYLDQYVPDGEVWYIDHPTEKGVYARFEPGEMVTEQLIETRFGLAQNQAAQKKRRAKKKE